MESLGSTIWSPQTKSGTYSSDLCVLVLKGWVSSLTDELILGKREIFFFLSIDMIIPTAFLWLFCEESPRHWGHLSSP